MESYTENAPSIKLLRTILLLSVVLITYITGIDKIYTVGEMIAYFVIVYCLLKSMFLGFYLMLEGVKVSVKSRLFMEKVLIALGYKTSKFTNRDIARILFYMYTTVLISVAFYNGYFNTPILKLF